MCYYYGNFTCSGIVNGADNQVQSVASTSYLYDQAGNRFMTFSNMSQFNEYYYDNRNRLDEVVAGPSFTTDVQYGYDPGNNRLQEEDVNGGTTTYTEFAHDPDGNLLMIANGGGTIVSAYLPDPTGGVAPLAQEDISGNVAWLLTDQNGSVQDVVTNGGGLNDRVLFNAFGQKAVADSNPTLESIYGFQGMIQSLTMPATLPTLYYDNARYYDPATEDFISQDPKGYSAGDSNLYRFVNNDPVNLTDTKSISRE